MCQETIRAPPPPPPLGNRDAVTKDDGKKKYQEYQAYLIGELSCFCFYTGYVTGSIFGCTV